ncbi:MAG: 4Fe-4S binding protein [Bacteroidaceae bacterium]|nr:4Fe-4S binding protein [Bacteroidaceae bacterium]
MLRKIRIVLAIVFWLLITWLLVDFTGTAHAYLGWMARIQFLPALLALNVGALLFVVALTLLFGRIYCSIICPLGVMQDAIAWFNRKKNKYSYSPEKRVLRGVVLVVTGALITMGLASIAGLVAPYSTYGRIVGSTLAPLWRMGNNVLADAAAREESYAFYTVDVWLKSAATLGVSVALWVVIAVLAWRGGRTWCNTICPVGTVLGLLARSARLKVVIDPNRCVGCRKCERKCKAACIDTKHRAVDYSRCVVCGDCLGQCDRDAISFGFKSVTEERKPTTDARKERVAEGESHVAEGPADEGRRAVLAGGALLAATAIVRAQEKTTDGGLAVIEDKVKPARMKLITPPGSLSARNMAEHCTACQLCITACPNDVLRPSGSLHRFMQPEVSYERGYCRPECNRCSEVCPTGAIRPIAKEARAAIQVGHAVWVEANCIPAREGKPCGLCERRCPAGAIQLVVANTAYQKRDNRWYDPNNNEIDGRLVPRIPVINEEKCVGCGACENLCPTRPFSAIYVEGHDVHREI